MKTEETADDLRPAPSSSFSYIASPPICLVVGDISVAYAEFFVHQSLICLRSEFFVKALRGQGSASNERTVSLPDCDPETVSPDLAQTNKLPPRDLAAHSSNMTDKYFTLGKLYVLAVKLLDAIAQNTVLDELHVRDREQEDEGVHSQPSPETIRTIYCDTPGGSKAREWLVDLYANHISDGASLNLMIIFCPRPAQLLSVKKELAETKTKAETYLKVTVQQGAQFAKTETQLRERLAQTEGQLKAKTELCEGMRKDMNTMQGQRDQAWKVKAGLEEDLRKANAEVAVSKRRVTPTWDRPTSDVYRPR
ncbi:uncharacterized protein M421DRAFT_4847 [Didymella exigua CBS 183.55]|uniref:BTB domain-containing protein n=1 Tax=Didymella exigua CBS 183.55 TaxID=1150837 RepID=A0A6A5RNY6_9PLEO|nr:uncharacterized protein M421DRAFT_4847 [Didymella exigua CBS 183.55]KAF1929030.1 hypothetical protein M421DRAFT_4847 [Didymella exigua CBS 183.55]